MRSRRYTGETVVTNGVNTTGDFVMPANEIVMNGDHGSEAPGLEAGSYLRDCGLIV